MEEQNASLIEEATEELVADITQSIDEAEVVAPTQNDISSVNEMDVNKLLGDLHEELNPDKIDENLSEAHKWFLICERADALDDGEYGDLNQRIKALSTMVEVFNSINRLIDKELIPALEEAHEIASHVHNEEHKKVVQQYREQGVDDTDTMGERKSSEKDNQNRTEQTNKEINEDGSTTISSENNTADSTKEDSETGTNGIESDESQNSSIEDGRDDRDDNNSETGFSDYT